MAAMRKLPLILLAAAGSASAHDLWVQPGAFWLSSPGTVPVSILVGHGKDRENWGIRSDRIVLLRSMAPDGKVTDFKPLIRPRSAAPAIPLPFRQPGTHLVAMESSHASSDLPAAKFNDYAKEEGLTPAIVHRQRMGANGRAGRELYSRRAKALVQVGKIDPSAKSAATNRIGMTLEIVPERNPYNLGPAQKLPLLVYYEGRPLAGALVKLTKLEQDAKPAAAQRTDGAGRTTFNVPRRGKWQLNVIWTKPIPGNPKADFETTFSSLSFGYPS
jgi:uncharacterized GH25 family protein